MKVLSQSAFVLLSLALLAGCGPTAKPDARNTERPPAQPSLDSEGVRKAPKRVLPETDAPTIKLKDESGTAVDVVGVPLKELESLKQENRSVEKWAELFAVFVDRGEGVDRTDQTAMLGAYRIENDRLRFEPRFPLAPGVRYRAVFNTARLPGRIDSKEQPLETTLLIPKPKTIPTVVQQVYPTRDDLPENHLKFYLHFSAPMSAGEAFEHIQLLNEAGKPVEQPFLELEQWDPERKRLTLRIDPGRVKQGLKPREDLGPVLEKGKKYTLVIDAKWSDGNGEPLKESFTKSFRAVAADETQPDPMKWKIGLPPANTSEPLTVAFGKSLDHGLLEHVLQVEDEKGRRVQGTVEIAEKETVWRFLPKEPWKAGAYHIVVETKLEDLAGNNIERPFEVDVFHPIEREVKTKTVKVAFEVK